MTQPDGKAGQPKKATPATKTSKATQGTAQKSTTKVAKADKIWIGSIILLLAAVAVVSYVARSGGDTPPPVVIADEERDFDVDAESIIELEPDAESPDADAEPGIERAAATGALVVTSDVQGAAVYLNGKRVGKTPHKATPLPPGTYAVKVVQSGYEDFETNVDVSTKTHTLRADLKRATTTFKVDANISGATVTLDGKERGTTPVEITKLDPGTYELVVRASGYKTHSETVEYDGGARVIRVAMESATIVLNEAVAVKHKHRLRGGCEGVLRASAEGLRFETEHKDAFFVSFTDLETLGFKKDELSLKITDGKKYDFVERNDNDDALARFHERVDEALTLLSEEDSQER